MTRNRSGPGPSRARVVLSAVVALAAATAAAAQEAGVPEGLGFLRATVTDEQIAVGKGIYAENCAACHGAQMQGEPDWRRRKQNGRMPAPPHDQTGHTWMHPDNDLFIITKLGLGAVVPGYESDMPVYEGILDDGEIAAVLAYIKNTWPARQREVQARITEKDAKVGQ